MRKKRGRKKEGADGPRKQKNEQSSVGKGNTDASKKKEERGVVHMSDIGWV